MQSNVSFNKTYSLLTKTDEANSAENFFESLKYRENGYYLVSILEMLESDYEIVEGFLHKGLMDDKDVNTFRTCLIRQEDINQSILDDLNKKNEIRNVEVLEDNYIRITIK